MDESQSVTHWIHQLKEGDEGVAQYELWKRYFGRLTALARKQLVASPRRASDEEDVALDVLNSCFTRARRGEFPDLHDRTDLWRLLVKITTRKVINQRRAEMAQKRGSGAVRGESVFLAPHSQHFGSLEELVVAEEPPPDVIAAIHEELRYRLGMLNQGLRQVARLKLEGYSNQEIGRELGRVERTIQRKLSIIRNIWNSDQDQETADTSHAPWA